MAITEYGVLEGLTVGELRLRVEDHIKTGWQPLGGVAVVQTFTDYGTISRDCSGKYIQAMVRYAQEPQKEGKTQ